MVSVNRMLRWQLWLNHQGLVHCYFFLGNICVVISNSHWCFRIKARILHADFVRLCGSRIMGRLGIYILIYDIHLLRTHAAVFFTLDILDLNLILAFPKWVRNIYILDRCENWGLLMLIVTILMLKENGMTGVSYNLLPFWGDHHLIQGCSQLMITVSRNLVLQSRIAHYTVAYVDLRPFEICRRRLHLFNSLVSVGPFSYYFEFPLSDWQLFLISCFLALSSSWFHLSLQINNFCLTL